MIRMNTDAGQITVDSAVYTNIAGFAATNCFGVKGMAVRSMTDGLVHLLRKEAMGKGVKVTFSPDNCTSWSTKASISAQSRPPSSARSAISSPSPRAPRCVP